MYKILANLLLLFVFSTVSVAYAEEELDDLFQEQEEDFQVTEDESEEDGEEEQQGEKPKNKTKSKNNAKTKVKKKSEQEEIKEIFEEDRKPADNFKKKVVLQALNKITARTSNIEIVTGSNQKFGNLNIHLKFCWKSPAQEAPDDKALLEIWEQKPGEKKVKIFHGWMFSSSPAISALEHPVYDLTVLSCD
jgi:hypothetical protein